MEKTSNEDWKQGYSRIHVFTGSYYYVNKKLTEMKKDGWKVVSSRKWSDGKYSYKMGKN